MLNAGAVWTPPDDGRVHLHRGDALTGVGAVKRRACELAVGEILVECDHDDVLATSALTAGLRERGCYRSAHRFACLAANLKPLQIPDDILFVAPWVYQWGILFEYSITSYWVGEFRSSFAACKRLLTIQTLSEECRALTISNAQHAVRELSRGAAQPPARERKLKHTSTPTRGRAAR